MEIIYARSCFYQREYFILLDSVVIIDMRLCLAEFDEIMLLQSSTKTIIAFLASTGKFCKWRFFCFNFVKVLQLVEIYV